MSPAPVAPDATPAPVQASSTWPRWIRAHAELFRIARVVAWPKLDLLVRLAIAQAFFVSGVLKVTNWDAALYLAEHEYPVRWMTPVLAAWLGAGIELVGPVLLSVGLMTRYAALPMLTLTLVEQFSYNALDSQLFTAALLGWYVVQGAAGLSLDALLRRGLADSALPLAPRIVRASAWVRSRVSPYFLAALRVWLGLALLLGGTRTPALSGQTAQELASWLPLRSASVWPLPLALGAGALLMLGLGTSYVAIALLLVTAGAAIMSSPFAVRRRRVPVLDAAAAAGRGGGRAVG